MVFCALLSIITEFNNLFRLTSSMCRIYQVILIIIVYAKNGIYPLVLIISIYSSLTRYLTKFIIVSGCHAKDDQQNPSIVCPWHQGRQTIIGLSNLMFMSKSYSSIYQSLATPFIYWVILLPCALQSSSLPIIIEFGWYFIMPWSSGYLRVYRVIRTEYVWL